MFIQEEGQEAHTVTFLANKGPMQPGASCFEGQGAQRGQPVKANGGFFMLTRIEVASVIDGRGSRTLAVGL